MVPSVVIREIIRFVEAVTAQFALERPSSQLVVRLQFVFFRKLPVAKTAPELEVILGVNLPVRHHCVNAMKHPATVGTNSFLVVPQVQPQRFSMFVGDSTNLARVHPFRRVDLSDVLLYDGRSGKYGITLGALGALFCVAEHVAIEGSLTAEAFRTVGTLIGQFAGVESHVDLEGAFVQESAVTLLAFQVFNAIMNLFVLFQGGSEFERFKAYFTR